MKWCFPAKTFLLGEYVAVTGGPALVLTTAPCFEVTLSQETGLNGIHPASPAGRWWTQATMEQGLSWFDPYQNRGGMGASSAQFLGAYYASCYLHNKMPTLMEMHNAYAEVSWNGQGLRPSGYDVLAQSLYGCVYIHHQQHQYQIYNWPFDDLAFILLHTGKKLATHHHLQHASLPEKIIELAGIVESGKRAFESSNGFRLIEAVNAYHEQLMIFNLVAEGSQQYLEWLRQQPGVLAAKGCGAMGADVLLLLVSRTQLSSVLGQLSLQDCDVLATSEDLYTKAGLFENNLLKTLEISA
ncbi:mevalonate kinase family protein [Legionella oakridgensis]|uniref:Mevalonate kinase n=2 Tax=Legionella oakridgensis TaxID=29423 RepID=W0BE67_9GAMM|nr:hypothetical protein [Legionella oakridgensis]AHE68165.1 hypothetical protein Loa_02631 [Legionella oakridgensis ATCC 33761 = DSM 21215]ETO92254.1 hypothetical protein LOR_64c16930 [Legionella oakridgensis RV-2-2007]KTD39634.1 hypothetical protein Loak_1060 [Legionella oakridgensis]STY21130.1 Uncharacterised protein [Legionella longbeachae]